jgi:hypothetical protein
LREYAVEIALGAFLVGMVLFLVFVLFGCGGSASSDQDVPESEAADWTRLAGASSDGFYRYVDEEAGVVCYYAATKGINNRAVGLACLPLGETGLGSE